MNALTPWTTELSAFGPIAAMGFLVAATCGLLGNYLVLRRMSLVGDAISHSILPGLAIAYLVTKSLSPPVMFIGAAAAGVATTLLIELIQSRSRIKADAAIGITFCSLFAIGVILIKLAGDNIHLDAECVLYGELAYIALEPPTSLFGAAAPPLPILIMGGVFVLTALLITIFYKELLITSFDPGLAAAQGFAPRLVHYALMALLSIVVVAAFDAVGAVLVVAMLILPASTAGLLSTRLPVVMLLGILHAALSTFLGITFGYWFDCSLGASIVVAGGALFGLAWAFAPRGGLIARALARSETTMDSGQISAP